LALVTEISMGLKWSREWSKSRRQFELGHHGIVRGALPIRACPPYLDFSNACCGSFTDSGPITLHANGAKLIAYGRLLG
jgi:hypothetical protein